MNWEDLNKDNIEEIKELYIEYIQENKKYNYTANLLTFEQFIKKLVKCDRCGKIIIESEVKSNGIQLYCDCCYDEMYKI